MSTQHISTRSNQVTAVMLWYFSKRGTHEACTIVGLPATVQLAIDKLTDDADEDGIDMLSLPIHAIESMCLVLAKIAEENPS